MKYGFFHRLWVKIGDERLRKIPKRYAALSAEEIEKRMQDDNEKRLAKYVAKLTNHAIKETTKRSVIMYPKIGNRKKEKPTLIPVDDDEIENPFEVLNLQMSIPFTSNEKRSKNMYKKYDNVNNDEVLTKFFDVLSSDKMVYVNFTYIAVQENHG